jgi:cell filamentation protein
VSWDPYLDLETGVLRNRLGITTSTELAQAEIDFTTVRIAQLGRRPLPGHYDLDHLRAFHRVIFGDVYDWAGQLRTVRLGKARRVFCPPQHIESEAAEIFEWLAEQRFLRGLDRTTFVDNLTELLSEINYLHPFREGNGRTQRAFLGQLANDAGYELDWTKLDPQANDDAARSALDGDLRPLRAMLESLVHARDTGAPPLPPPAPRRGR